MNGTLSTVPAELAGKLVMPDDRRYRLLRSTYTTVGHPAAVVLPESAGDVAAALRLARETGLGVAIRSGGHGLSGSGTNNGGLVIDLSALHRVDVLDRGSRLVRVEAGARWAQVAQALAPHRLAISSGDHGNVGVGGIATGAASDGSYGSTGSPSTTSAPSRSSCPTDRPCAPMPMPSLTCCG